MRRGVHEGVRCVADTRLHNRSDKQAAQFARQTGVGNMVRGVEAETCTRRVSQVVVTIDGVVEADHVVRKCRSHGPVLPVSMVKCVHRINTMSHHTLRSVISPIIRLNADSSE